MVASSGKNIRLTNQAGVCHDVFRRNEKFANLSVARTMRELSNEQQNTVRFFGVGDWRFGNDKYRYRSTTTFLFVVCKKKRARLEKVRLATISRIAPRLPFKACRTG
jgi:hypothetical protein